MSRLWKTLIVISLVLNATSLVYVYALLHSNPYGPQYYETEQLKMDVRELKLELDKLKESQ